MSFIESRTARTPVPRPRGVRTGAASPRQRGAAGFGSHRRSAGGGWATPQYRRSTGSTAQALAGGSYANGYSHEALHASSSSSAAAHGGGGSGAGAGTGAAAGPGTYPDLSRKPSNASMTSAGSVTSAGSGSHNTEQVTVDERGVPLIIAKVQHMPPHEVQQLEHRAPTGLSESQRIQALTHLQSFTNLTRLAIVGHAIRRMTGLEALRHLELLDLSQNRIRAIQGVGHMTQLQTLRLRGNFISRLPKALSNLAALRTLDVGGNNCSVLKDIESLAPLSNLSDLDLSANPFCSLPQYASFVIFHQRALHRLDGATITAEKRRASVLLFDPATAKLEAQRAHQRSADQAAAEAAAQAQRANRELLEELAATRKLLDQRTQEWSTTQAQYQQLEQQLAFYRIDHPGASGGKAGAASALAAGGGEGTNTSTTTDDSIMYTETVSTTSTVTTVTSLSTIVASSTSLRFLATTTSASPQELAARVARLANSEQELRGRLDAANTQLEQARDAVQALQGEVDKLKAETKHVHSSMDVTTLSNGSDGQDSGDTEAGAVAGGAGAGAGASGDTSGAAHGSQSAPEARLAATKSRLRNAMYSRRRLVAWLKALEAHIASAKALLIARTEAWMSDTGVARADELEQAYRETAAHQTVAATVAALPDGTTTDDESEAHAGGDESAAAALVQVPAFHPFEDGITALTLVLKAMQTHHDTATQRLKGVRRTVDHLEADMLAGSPLHARQPVSRLGRTTRVPHPAPPAPAPTPGARHAAVVKHQRLQRQLQQQQQRLATVQAQADEAEQQHHSLQSQVQDVHTKRLRAERDLAVKLMAEREAATEAQARELRVLRRSVSDSLTGGPAATAAAAPAAATHSATSTTSNDGTALSIGSISPRPGQLRSPRSHNTLTGAQQLPQPVATAVHLTPASSSASLLSRASSTSSSTHAFATPTVFTAAQAATPASVATQSAAPVTAAAALASSSVGPLPTAPASQARLPRHQPSASDGGGDQPPALRPAQQSTGAAGEQAPQQASGPVGAKRPVAPVGTVSPVARRVATRVSELRTRRTQRANALMQILGHTPKSASSARRSTSRNSISRNSNSNNNGTSVNGAGGVSTPGSGASTATSSPFAASGQGNDGGDVDDEDRGGFGPDEGGMLQLLEAQADAALKVLEAPSPREARPDRRPHSAASFDPASWAAMEELAHSGRWAPSQHQHQQQQQQDTPVGVGSVRSVSAPRAGANSRGVREEEEEEGGGDDDALGMRSRSPLNVVSHVPGVAEHVRRVRSGQQKRKAARSKRRSPRSGETPAARSQTPGQAATQSQRQPHTQSNGWHGSGGTLSLPAGTADAAATQASEPPPSRIPRHRRASPRGESSTNTQQGHFFSSDEHAIASAEDASEQQKPQGWHQASAASRSGSGAIRPAPDAAASRSSSRGRAAASRRVPVVAPRSQWGRAVLQEAQASAASGALSSSGRQHHGSRGRAVTPTGQRASGGAAPASAGPRVGSGSSGAATMRSAARVASRWPALGLSAEDCFDEDSLYHPATVALYSGASKSGRSASAGRRRQRGGEGGGGGVTPEPRQGDGLLYASDLVASVPRSASAPRGVHSSGTGGRNIFKSPMDRVTTAGAAGASSVDSGASRGSSHLLARDSEYAKEVLRRHESWQRNRGGSRAASSTTSSAVGDLMRWGKGST